jgi:periplasmic mercuric ion binding protein
MRQQWIATIAAAATLSLFSGQALADKVEVKGVHLCCGNCVNIAKKLLAKAEGVSDVEADKDSKTVTFTAADEKAVKAGLHALHAGGLFGKATSDGKEIKVKAHKKGEKADEITIKSVHVCCGACKKALAKVFEGSKVSFSGKGAVQNLTISGKDLDKGEVLDSLREAGFNGTIAK